MSHPCSNDDTSKTVTNKIDPWKFKSTLQDVPLNFTSKFLTKKLNIAARLIFQTVYEQTRTLSEISLNVVFNEFQVKFAALKSMYEHCEHLPLFSVLEW